MAWFWTDDLARILVESARISESAVRDWISAPVAVAAADGAEPLAVAMDLAGLSDEPQVA